MPGWYTYSLVGATAVGMYLSQRISGGSWVHIGSIFRKVLQAKALLYRGTEL